MGVHGSIFCTKKGSYLLCYLLIDANLTALQICSQVFYLCFPSPSAASEPSGLHALTFSCNINVNFDQPELNASCSFLFQIFQHVILDLPGLAFFTTYAVLALFWAEILYQARGLMTNRLRLGFYTINVVVYALQVKLDISKSALLL